METNPQTTKSEVEIRLSPEYRRGYKCAIEYIKGDKNITAQEAYQQALSDLYEDAFNSGWIAGCMNCGAEIE